MNKLALISAIILVLMLLAGCEKETTAKKTTATFIGGTDSVAFGFLEGAPPEEVYDGNTQEFEVTLSVENKGEYDVAKDNIKLDLTGFYPPEFNSPVVSKNPDEDLDSAYIDSEGNKIPGTVTYVNFPAFNFLGKLAGNNDYKIRANLCYIYGTKAQADLCILEDMTDMTDTVCKVSEKKNVESSSAPIKAENLEENVAGNEKVTFSFEIVHRGTGMISRFGSGCDDEVGNKNKVWVDIDDGLPGLACSPLEEGTATTGFVTLYGGKRLVRCTQETTGLTGDFEKKANINLKYDYKEHVERILRVKHSTE